MNCRDESNDTERQTALGHGSSCLLVGCVVLLCLTTGAVGGVSALPSQTAASHSATATAQVTDGVSARLSVQEVVSLRIDEFGSAADGSASQAAVEPDPTAVARPWLTVLIVGGVGLTVLVGGFLWVARLDDESTLLSDWSSAADDRQPTSSESSGSPTDETTEESPDTGVEPTEPTEERHDTDPHDRIEEIPHTSVESAEPTEGSPAAQTDVADPPEGTHDADVGATAGTERTPDSASGDATDGAIDTDSESGDPSDSRPDTDAESGEPTDRRSDTDARSAEITVRRLTTDTESDELTTELPEIDVGATEPTDESADTDAETAEPADRTSDTDTESTAEPTEGSASEPTADSGSESADSPEHLLSNEERILQLMRENGGRIKQQRVVSEFDWSAARTSQLVKQLREDDEIEVFRLGRENVLKLPGENDSEGS